MFLWDNCFCLLSWIRQFDVRLLLKMILAHQEIILGPASIQLATALQDQLPQKIRLLCLSCCWSHPPDSVTFQPETSRRLAYFYFVCWRWRTAGLQFIEKMWYRYIQIYNRHVERICKWNQIAGFLWRSISNEPRRSTKNRVNWLLSISSAKLRFGVIE